MDAVDGSERKFWPSCFFARMSQARKSVLGEVMFYDNILLVSARPQMVDFGSEQGLSNFETAGISGYVEDFKRAKTPLRAKRCRLWMGTSYNSSNNRG